MKEAKGTLDWEVLTDLSDIEVPTMGTALVVIGMKGCEPCEIVKEQIATFLSKHHGATARLYKFDVKGRPAAERLLLGEELRFFPTVVGCLDGVVAFKLQGALVDATPSDISRLERGFGRLTAGRASS